MATADVSPDGFIFSLREYDTDVFSERVSPHCCDVCVSCCLPFPGTGIFASKCSALHEPHPEKQTHKALGSRDTNMALLSSPFLRQLQELGIAWPPTFSLLLFLKTCLFIFQMAKIWHTLPEAGEQFSSLCWSLCLSGGAGWIGDMLSEAETFYCKYILFKAGVYVERWTHISCFVFKWAFFQFSVIFLLWELWGRLERGAGCTMACEKELGIWYSK